MKAVKITGGLVIALIAIVAVVAYLLLSNLDDIVKRVIEDVGSQVTGTSVSLDAVKIDLATGKGKLKGLTIDNPRGFDSDYAFKLDNIVVAVAPASLSKAVIVISQVKVDGAKLIAEQKGATTNLSKLLENIEKSSEKGKGDKGTAEPAPDRDSANVRLMIERFTFTGTRATILAEGKEEKSLTLPDVKRKNIGDKRKGLSPEQLAEEVLGSVVEEVEKAVAEHLAGLAAEAVEKKLTEKMSDEDKSKVEGLKSLFKKSE